MNLNSKNKVIEHFIDDQKRDLIIIIPGGGYKRTSPRENLPIVDEFAKKGYHAVVFEYRHEMLVHPFVKNEGHEVINFYKNDKRVNKLFIIGFSAGGHLAANLLIESSNIDGAILCYPVITSDKRFSHNGSVDSLLGSDKSEKRLLEFSLEKNVKHKTAPVFIWHTLDDKSVPVENTLLFVEALRKVNVDIESHIFRKGRHGLSLANEKTPFDEIVDVEKFALDNKSVSIWIELMFNWLDDIKKEIQ